MSGSTAHYGHQEGEWFWGCDGCNPVDTDMGGRRTASNAVQVALEKLDAYRSWSSDGFAYPEAREYTEAVAKLNGRELAEFMERASFKERPARRRRGERRPAQTIPLEAQPTYPPDPYWGADDKGRFHYVDYDCESLVLRFEDDGDLWVDKRGEGPVYVRKEDIPVLIDALQRVFADSEVETSNGND